MRRQVKPRNQKPGGVSHVALRWINDCGSCCLLCFQVLRFKPRSQAGASAAALGQQEVNWCLCKHTKREEDDRVVLVAPAGFQEEDMGALRASLCCSEKEPLVFLLCQSERWAVTCGDAPRPHPAPTRPGSRTVKAKALSCGKYPLMSGLL